MLVRLVAERGEIELVGAFAQITVADQGMAFFTDENPAAIGTLVGDDTPAPLAHHAQHGKLCAVRLGQMLRLGQAQGSAEAVDVDGRCAAFHHRLGDGGIEPDAVDHHTVASRCRHHGP